MSLLRVSGLTKRFGGVVAVDNVGLDVEQGQIKGLIGPNGAGKSTLFNCISGFERYDSGTITFQSGTCLRAGDQRQALRLGITRSFQTPALFDDLTVRDNLLVPLLASGSTRFLRAAAGPLLPGNRRRWRAALAECQRVMEAFDIDRWADSLAGDLPAGTRRIVELVRAVSAGSVDVLTSRKQGSRGPQLLLLDEPAAGLNPSETAALGAHVRRVRQMGITVLLVEHDLGLVMSLCDEVVVLDHGRKIAEGPARLVQRDEAVIAAYVGTGGKAGSELPVRHSGLRSADELPVREFRA
ncbi:MAG: ABC transporter ATP-binding protein [Actinomycetes bacterium]|jgi:ABC-type branched-subunit amino acid transport system ATPase component|nr:ABC transporter ATP-binding protein [Actinomycetes bacterium]